MDFYWLSRTLEDNPAIRVLRAENGPIILGFLHRAFKENHLITIANQDLVLQLAAFLEEQGYEEGADGDVLDRAATLLENWCGEKSRYVRKYNDDRGVVQHELTPALETVFRWLEYLQPRDFVGTESRFQNLLHRLRELVQGSGEDPQRRIRELEAKRAELDSRIARIRATGEVDSYSLSGNSWRRFAWHAVRRRLSRCLLGRRSAVTLHRQLRGAVGAVGIVSLCCYLSLCLMIDS